MRERAWWVFQPAPDDFVVKFKEHCGDSQSLRKHKNYDGH